MNESQRGALTSLPSTRTGDTYTGKHSDGSVNGVTCMCTCTFPHKRAVPRIKNEQ